MFKSRELFASLMAGYGPPQAECQHDSREVTCGCPACTDKPDDDEFSGRDLVDPNNQELLTCGCPACTDKPDRPDRPKKLQRDAAGLTSLRRELRAALAQPGPA